MKFPRNTYRAVDKYGNTLLSAQDYSELQKQVKHRLDRELNSPLHEMQEISYDGKVLGRVPVA